MKAEWETRFSSRLTKMSDFFVTEDESVMVAMMEVSASVRFAKVQELDASAIELPYRGGEVILRLYPLAKMPWCKAINGGLWCLLTWV